MNRNLALTVTLVTLLVTLPGVLGSRSYGAQEASTAAEAKTVPVIDGGLGSCTADFTITDTDGKPLYDAKIKVHIAYGFLGAHKLDLEVGTNNDGKARFTGLPERLRRGGLFFQASQGDLYGEAFDDPTKTCKPQFAVTLRKKAQ